MTKALYLITKLQNLKAIHNEFHRPKYVLLVVSNYKITKSESYSQQRYTISATKAVVSNYKITKSESYSQRRGATIRQAHGCI